MLEFDMGRFRSAHGISEEVAKAHGFDYFAVGDTDIIIDACRGHGKSDEAVAAWANALFSDTDGLMELRYGIDGTSIMPEVKVFWPVKMGPIRNHVHVDLGGRPWAMEHVLQFVPRQVLAAYVVVGKPKPPKEVMLQNGVTVTKFKKMIVDGRKKLVFRHRHDQMTEAELRDHLALLHGVASNYPKMDKAHSHSISCYSAASKSMWMHIHKGAETVEESEMEWYVPSTGR